MPVTVDALKDLATKALQAKYGDSIGKAYGFLLFGGYGVPGLADGAQLAARANAEAANELTGDLALGLATDVAKATISASLEAAAADALAAAGLTAEAVAGAATLI